jgi:plastocyanin
MHAYQTIEFAIDHCERPALPRTSESGPLNPRASVEPTSRPVPYYQTRLREAQRRPGAVLRFPSRPPARRDMLRDTDRDPDQEGEDSSGPNSHRLHVMAGTGEVTATPGGPQTFSTFRFRHGTATIHAGDTVEWTNSDPVAPHTITLGTEPATVLPPNFNVTVDEDGARHAVINSTSDSVN